MRSRLLRPLTAAAAAAALLIPTSAAHAAPDPAADENHGARTCLEGRDDAAVRAPLTLNVVANCSFEQDDFRSSSRSWLFGGAGDTSRLETETLSGGAANTFGLITRGATNNHVWQAVPTVPGRSYVVSADVRVGNEAGGAPSGVFLTAKGQNPDGSQNQSAVTQLTTDELSDATQWTRKSFTFTAVNWRTFVGAVKWAAQDPDGAVAATTMAIDNLTVVEQESYELVWNDEFDGDALDQDTWGYELGNVRGNEQQHYSSSTDNVDVVDGDLVLAATNRPAADRYRNTDRWGAGARTVKYNSGSVRTEGRQEFLYGRVEARMRLPEGKGAFPAFWMLGADFHLDGRVNPEQGYSWPSTGELDIMEIIGAPTQRRAAEGERASAGTSNRVAYGTPHFYYTAAGGDGTYAPRAIGGNVTTADNLSEGYHVFGIDWNPDYLAWYMDGVVYNVMYFPTDETTAEDNRAFAASEVARFTAAAESLNRPQYLQLNLATGGKWAGDAGDHLADDGAALRVDWVRYYRSASQSAAADAYYADQPRITGADDRVIRAGEAADLLSGVSTDSGYRIDYSINDEHMFVNGGAEGGRNEVHRVVDSSTDSSALQALEPGVYSLHYSALAEGADYTGAVTPQHRVARRTVLLTVLPENGLHGVQGEPLASVPLPAGWSWVDPGQTLQADSSYPALFTQAADTTVEPGARRSIRVAVPVVTAAPPVEDEEDAGAADGDAVDAGTGAGPESIERNPVAGSVTNAGLAATGADSSPYVLAGAALLLLGGAFALRRRRRMGSD